MNKIQSFIAVFAHPDDESYRAGGTLALLAQKCALVWVLCATQGEQGIPKLRPQALLTWPLDGVSSHSDHMAVSRWTREAFKQVADPAAYPEH